MIHAAPIDSPRLAPVLAFLRQRGDQGATTAELRELANSMAPHTDVSELRASGLTITCQYERMTEEGRKVYRYYLQNSD